MVKLTFGRHKGDEVGVGGGTEQANRAVAHRRARRAGLAVAVAGVIAAGCAGPEVPLSVGLADRPVELLLGQRASDVAEAPVPPVAIPPSVLPDLDFPFPMPMPFPTDGFEMSPGGGPFPSWATTTSTLPAGCTNTPPGRTFDDAPDNIKAPPLETTAGHEYVTRTEGEITVDDDTVAGTMLPTLTKRRVENVQVLSRFPAGQDITYSDKTKADNQPYDFTFDVVADVGKAENNTSTTYRVQAAHIIVVYNDYYRFDTAADGKQFLKWDQGETRDNVIDDFFSDLNGDGDLDDINERYPDFNGSGEFDSEDYGPDLDGDGTFNEYPHEYYIDNNGNGSIEEDEYHYDMNGNGVIDYAPDPDGDGPLGKDYSKYNEENYYNSYYTMRQMLVYKADGKGDNPSFTNVPGGMYISSMLTGEKEANRVTFAKAKDEAGNLVDSPGAKLAVLPLVESNTINTEAYTADGRMSISFESTVFGRVDVDVCRTDMVAWKVALDRGFIANPQSAVDFSAEYSIGTQHGGLFMQDKSVVKSIQAGSPTVTRTIESVFTAEPAPATDPDPRGT